MPALASHCQRRGARASVHARETQGSLVIHPPDLQTRRMRPSRRLPLSREDVVRLLSLLVLFAIVLLIALATDVFDHITPGVVHEWVRRTGVWAPVAYLVGFVVRPLSLVPLSVWLVVGGIAFGWTWAALYAVAGVSVGAAAEFMAARLLGREFVARFLSRLGGRGRRLPKVWGARLVLSLQLVPFMPHDLINVAAGCSGIPYWRFLLGSSLGTLPGILLFTYAGSVLMAPGTTRFYAAFAALAALVLVSFAAARRLRSGLGGVAGDGEQIELEQGESREGGPRRGGALEPSAPEGA